MFSVHRLFTVVLATLFCHLVLAAADDVNLCGQFDMYNSTTVPYSFNNNAWGNDSSGYQCMTVHDAGKSFSVTYKWTGDASLVKSYPYMKADPYNLPVQLWNISKLQISGNWRTYVSGKENASAAEQAKAFDDIALYANVAIDMFLSDNITNSTLTGPPIEIMIWPWWIPTVKPLGWGESTPDIDVVVIDGTPFSLYHGFNDGGQNVFSWLSHVNLTKTDADYAPLLKYIWKKGLLSGALWLGQLELGTEVKHAAAETHFEASNYTLKLIRQGDPDDVTTTMTTAKPTPTPTNISTTLEQPAASITPTSTNVADHVAPGVGVVPSWLMVLAMMTGGYVLG